MRAAPGGFRRMTKFRVFFSLNGVVEVDAETGEKAMDAISNINLIPYIKKTEPYDFEEVKE